MRIIRITTLSGPNVWSRRPVLEALVDLEELKDSPSNTLPGLYQRLSAWLPSLIEHKCSIGERGGFLQRVRDGTWPGHILEHVTIELQCLSGSPVVFGKARETATEGVYHVVVRYNEEPLARACLTSALDLYLSAAYDRPFDVQATLAGLRSVAADARLDPEMARLAALADERGIPVTRLPASEGLLLGHGIHALRVATPPQDPARTLDQAFPNGATGRIPLACVMGGRTRTAVARILADWLERSGLRTGAASSQGLQLPGRPLRTGDGSSQACARELLRDPSVEAAVVEASPDSVATEGLGFDRCSLAVVTGMDDTDRKACAEADTPERLFAIQRCGVDVVLQTGAAVLDASCPECLGMVELSAGGVVLYAASTDEGAAVARAREHATASAASTDEGAAVARAREHAAASAASVVVERDSVLLLQGAETVLLAPASALHGHEAGSEAVSPGQVLAAVAAATAMGIGPATIASFLVAKGRRE